MRLFLALQLICLSRSQRTACYSEDLDYSEGTFAILSASNDEWTGQVSVPRSAKELFLFFDHAMDHAEFVVLGGNIKYREGHLLIIEPLEMERSQVMFEVERANIAGVIVASSRSSSDVSCFLAQEECPSIHYENARYTVTSDGFAVETPSTAEEVFITFDDPVKGLAFSDSLNLESDYVLTASTSGNFNIGWEEPIGAMVSYITRPRAEECVYPFFESQATTTTSTISTTTLTTTTTTTTTASFSEPVTSLDDCPVLFNNDVKVEMLQDGLSINAPSSAVDLVLTFDKPINGFSITTETDSELISGRVLHLKSISMSVIEVSVNWAEEKIFPVVSFSKRVIPEDCEINSPEIITTTGTTTTTTSTTTTDPGVDSNGCPAIQYSNSIFSLANNLSGFTVQVPAGAAEIFITFDRPISAVIFSANEPFSLIGDFVLAIETSSTTISFDADWREPVGAVVSFVTSSRPDACHYPFFAREPVTTTTTTAATITTTTTTTVTTTSTTTVMTTTTTTATTTATTTTSEASTTTTTSTTSSVVFEGCHHVHNMHGISGSVHVSEWVTDSGKYKFHRDVLLPKNSPPAGWYLHLFFTKKVSQIKIWEFESEKVRKTKSKEWKLFPNDDSVLAAGGSGPYSFNFIGTSKDQEAGVGLTILICYN